MFDQLLGVLLLGLGLQSPITSPTVKGDSITRAQTFRREVEAKRKGAVDKYKTKQQTFQSKLKSIKDPAKKLSLEKVQNSITEVNAKRTTVMTGLLEKMIALHQRVIAKGVELKAAGKDMTSFDVASAAAQTAIERAQDAVLAQAGKQYIIAVTGEEVLKSNVETTRKLLEADLKSTNAVIVEARKSLSTAIKEL